MPWSDHQQAWHWAPGDRAKIFTERVPWRATSRYLNKGKVFVVKEITSAGGRAQLRGTTADGELVAPYAARCKPVVRVQAPSRPTIVELGAFHTSFFDCLDAMGGRVTR